MELNGRIIQRILLFTLAVLIVPLVAFPEQFGTQLARSSLIFVLYEVVYYCLVVFLLQRRGGLIQLVQSAGICLVYRLCLGATFGLLISVMFGMNIRVSIMLGLSSYLPAILFHVALTPFILKPIHDQFYNITTKQRERKPVAAPPPPESLEHGRTSLVVSRARGFVKDAPAQNKPASIPQPPGLSPEFDDEPVEAPPAITGDLNGFERAVRYIGEHGSVHLAAVVDHEGLLLAHFVRHQIDADDWAPLALVFFEQNERVLQRGNEDTLERLDLVLSGKRLSLARYGYCHLMVVSERESGDVLHIRLRQAMDMIRKFVDERYSDKLKPNAETIHVSSTE
jgi:predicted regulator of Ras-like GTPase activity (Roadblock/LC7/MglB family)